MGDYIQREAAIKAVKKERDYTGKFSFEEEPAWTVGFQQGITFALSDIASIPPADVRPVVRGEWEGRKTFLHGTIVKCSLCGNFLDLDGVNAGRGNANFCPNCGADMRPQEEDE